MNFGRLGRLGRLGASVKAPTAGGGGGATPGVGNPVGLLLALTYAS